MPLWLRFTRSYGCGSRGPSVSHIEDFWILQSNAGEAIRSLLRTSGCRGATTTPG